MQVSVILTRSIRNDDEATSYVRLTLLEHMEQPLDKHYYMCYLECCAVLLSTLSTIKRCSGDVVAEYFHDSVKARSSIVWEYAYELYGFPITRGHKSIVSSSFSLTKVTLKSTVPGV
ncbi:hypothetical protein ANAPRD1_00849 [Anaplasma phagocytophilum]|nr:hypothetical protein ANAPH2_00675 [Anaplasma phagocytophilum]SCV65452.1 hypothetical protein ANAPRD1_00849 [Anaplasma phagocytophilum]